MSAGRTTWFPRDAAWHRRELIVELGEEFGPVALAILDVIDAWAQEQRASGALKGGFRGLARESFVTSCHAESPMDSVRAVVSRAAGLGVLDDLEIAEDGRRFTCRVSGWESDQARGRAALRQAAKRNRDSDEDVTDGDDVTPCHDESRPSAQHNQTKEEPKEHLAATPQRSRADTFSRSKAEEVECPRCKVPAGEKCDGVRGKRGSCHLERHHAVGELLDRGQLKQMPNSTPASAGRYQPDEEIDRLLERFPDHSRDALVAVVMRLRTRGRPVSVESVGELLTREAA